MSVCDRSYASATSVSADGCDATEGGASSKVRVLPCPFAFPCPAPFVVVVVLEVGAAAKSSLKSKSAVLSIVTTEGAMVSAHADVVVCERIECFL